MWRALLAASLLAGCSTVDRVGQSVAGMTDGRPPGPDTALEAILNAAPIGCPNSRTLNGANHEAFGPQHGVVGTDIALTPLASDPTRAVRMRRLVVEPGGANALAVLLNNRAHFARRGPVLVILSGGNVDSDLFSQAIGRAPPPLRA